jgi:hypothetical protein
MRLTLLACGILSLTGCGPSSSGDEGVGMVDDLQTSEAGLTAFVREGRYRTWLAEPAPRPSVRAHGSMARVYFNEKVAQSLREGRSVHPVGSVLVKELFAADGKTLKAHAVNVKVAEGTGHDTWLFYEGFAPDYSNSYYGRGHGTCYGCHSEGVDYVTTALPE